MQWNELSKKLIFLYFLLILVNKYSLGLWLSKYLLFFSKQISAVDVDEETPSVLEPTDDGKKSNETNSETAQQTTEHPSNPTTDDNGQKEMISSSLDNLQQNETETEMNANVLINSELLDQDVKPHNLSSNVFMSNDLSLGSDATILIKSEDGVSRCHSADGVGGAAAVTAVKEEPQNESN